MNKDLDSLTLDVVEGAWRDAQVELSKVTTFDQLEEVRVKYAGRKGFFSEATKHLKSASPEIRPQLGQLINKVKNQLEALLEDKKNNLGGNDGGSSKWDTSLPGRRKGGGGVHILSRTMRDLKDILRGMNFEVVEGPEWETEFYNFDALNTPIDHPARDTQASFYVKGGGVLRTHTSPVQVRAMESRQPPLRVASVGKCFRSDDLDPSHSPVFHQVEGLMVGEGVSMAHLKGMLNQFFEEFFKQPVNLKFMPSFFPFVEPGAEVSVACVLCGGKGCPVCKHSGWLELMGAGMVHPNVFKAVGYDSERWTGFAFGCGVERLAMIKHGIDDIRLFYENDLRFLGQFR